MIILPTRKRLESRRNELYKHLQMTLQYAPVQQVEDIMRRIHIINLKLVTYFRREKENERKEKYQ